MLNRVVLVGRLTREVELRYTKSNIAVAGFTLAVDRKYKNADGNKETDFIDIVVWRGQAESCANYLHKGSLCAVDGSLQIRSYEAKDGTKRRVAEVVAESVAFLSPKSEGAHSQGATTDKPEPLYDPNSDLPF